MLEWERFRVGQLSTTPTWTEPTCRPLESICHVAHIRSAARILEDRRIKAGLVYDKSKLNRERIQVVWLSPNDWLGAGGFRYGNISFCFDLEPLIKNRRCYWVESVDYKVTAVRFLISDTNYSKILTPYDPAVDKGPWWFDTNSTSHYWNGEYCLEIMLDADLDLASASQIGAVKHHPDYCNILGSDCPDRGMNSGTAAARFLATVVGRQVDTAQLNWVADESPKPELQEGWAWLREALLKVIGSCQFEPSNLPSEESTKAIGRAMLAAYAHENLPELKALAAMVTSKEAAVEACGRAVAKHFGLIDWKMLED